MSKQHSKDIFRILKYLFVEELALLVKQYCFMQALKHIFHTS